MLVFKFGGASVKDAENIKNTADIISKFPKNNLLIVVSAMDKTTNELEKLAYLATQGNENETNTQFQKIQNFHYKIIEELFSNTSENVKNFLRPFLNELEKVKNGILLLGDYPSRVFDKIMAFGELFSSVIVSEYLKFKGLPVILQDARKLIKTDSNYRSAEVNWSLTENEILHQTKPVLEHNIVLVQGFIGSNSEGATTTLGREGSDFTASIFGNILNAESVIVWKDVIGILSGDPRIFPNAVKLEQISYKLAVEMTFYGATVIHPKTIKPLQNKKIPLRVRCFKDVNETGTIIGDFEHSSNQTITILKKNQTILTIVPKDFSFVDEIEIQNIFNYLIKLGLKVNLIQTSAISLQICIENNEQKIENFKAAMNEWYEIDVQTDLYLQSFLNIPTDINLPYPQLLISQKIGNHMLLVVKEPVIL